MSETGRLRRARAVRAYDRGDKTVIVGNDGRAHALEAETAGLARALLELLVVPRTRAEVAAEIEKLAGAPIVPGGPVDQLIELLLQTGAIEREPFAQPALGRFRGERLVLCVSGAVAAMHAPALVARFVERGFRVRVAATRSALRFFQPFAIETLVHHSVTSELFDAPSRVPHIELATWADVVVVWPATATTIARLATGNYESIASAIALATRAPVIVAPSMNADMFTGSAVQRNLAQLSRDGLHVIHPAFGLEVADAPDERKPELGPAPPIGVVVQLVEAALAFERKRAPRTAREWNDVYTTLAPEELPWHVPEPDADLIATLDRLAPEPASVLEIGTGFGQLAIAAAERGHRVVATDVSERALEIAGERAKDAKVLWIFDDVSETCLRARFDLVIDRGCLHALAPFAARRYAESVSELVVPGGALVIKTHAVSERDRHGTTPYDAQAMRALLGDAFELIEDHASTFPGPSRSVPARLFVLRRKSTA